RAVLAPAVATDTHPGDQPSMRKVVERRRLSREGPRTAAGEGCDHRADPNATRCHGDCGQRDPWVDERRVVIRPDVIPGEEAVPSRRLGGDRKIHQCLDVREGAKVRDIEGEFHRDAPADATVGLQCSLPGNHPTGYRSVRNTDVVVIVVVLIRDRIYADSGR